MRMDELCEPNESCPCGSGTKASMCCLSRGCWSKAPAFIVPPPPRTGTALPRCYARGLNDCGGKLTREHYFSHSFLRQLQAGGTVQVSGLKRQRGNEPSAIPTPALASKVMCRRHNEALSPLDCEFARLSETIDRFDEDLGLTRPQSQRPEIAVFAGPDIERWMLTCIIGLAASGAIGGAVAAECAEVLFGAREWPDEWGLYFVAVPNARVYHSGSLGTGTLVDPNSGTILATTFAVRGLKFVFAMCEPKSGFEHHVYRPRTIIMRSGANTTEMHVEFCWADPGHSQQIWLDRVGTYDGPGARLAETSPADRVKRRCTTTARLPLVDRALVRSGA